MSTLPPFPTDPATLDLIERAINPGLDAERSSVGDLCQMYSEMAGSDLDAVESEEDGICTMRDPVYHHNDVIEALVVEVRRLRTAQVVR